MEAVAKSSEASRANGELPAAVVFDFDGVIVDTEPLHFRAFAEVFAAVGLRLTEQAYTERYIGFDDREALAEGLAQAGITVEDARFRALLRRKAEAFSRLAREQRLAPLPGVAELVGALDARGVPRAICTGALPEDIDPILDRLGLAAAFPVRVTAADVARSKPDPASYRLAVERLARRHAPRPILPARCVAVEDTPAGIAAARAAGLRVLAVEQTHGRAALGAADRIVASLADATPEHLGALVT